MNFHVGTFGVNLDFWPNLNSPLDHLMKVVLMYNTAKLEPGNIKAQGSTGRSGDFLQVCISF